MGVDGVQIRASVLHGAKDLRIESRTCPAPSASEIQVAVRATGLCGSDLHYYNHGRNGDIIMREPMALGHESAGVVTAIGSEVSGFQVGDKVAMEVGVPCGACDRCSENRYNICKDMRFRSSAKSFPHFQGTLQDRINHPAAWCHKLPQNVSLELGAILEPLGVAIHATRRANLPLESTVLVFGAGAVGLLAAAMAKISGATQVVIADIDQGRVDFAVQNRFAHDGYTVPMQRGQSLEENLDVAKQSAAAVGKIQKASGAPIGEYDAVFECTGVPSCVQAAIYATRPGGKVMLIGMGTPIQTLPISAAALREVDIVGVFRYANTYATGIEVVSRSDNVTPDFSKLVTHKFQGLESAEKAFQMAGRTKDDSGKLVLKVVLETSEESQAQP